MSFFKLCIFSLPNLPVVLQWCVELICSGLFSGGYLRQMRGSHCQLAFPCCTQVTKDFPLRVSLHLCPWAKLEMSVVSHASTVCRFQSLHIQSQAEMVEVNGTSI